MSVRQPKSKSFIFVMAGLTGIASIGCYWQGSKYFIKKERWQKIDEQLSTYKPYELKEQEASNFPWYRDSAVDDWEYKLVKIKGRLGNERVFVRRPFEGRMGFDVMAPLYTTERSKANQTAILDNGIVVDMGWVPAEHKDEILPTPTNPTVNQKSRERSETKSCNHCFQKRTYLKSLAWFVKENLKPRHPSLTPP